MPLGKPLLDTLDRMGYGGVVLDASGRVLRINNAADRLLQETSPARDWRTCSDFRQALKSLLRLDAAARFTMKDEAWVVIRRDAEGRRPLALHAVPLADAPATGPHTVVILADLDATPRPTPDVLQKIFGLTPAEAKLATEIACGKSLEEIAEGGHIAIGTVRKQLASVFAKTHTNRQAQLVSLLAYVSILP